MPPLRNGRASKACDLCRKYKTRCYASQSDSGTCLRCETLSQRCSLGIASAPRALSQWDQPIGRPRQNGDIHESSVTDRLERLERTLEVVVERLDASLGASSVSVNASPPVVVGEAQPLSERDRDPAPVLLIRDATTDTFQDARQPIGVLESLDLDLISKGLMSSSTAFTLLKLFHTHYGRWVRFPEDMPTATLLSRIRKSPLLLCSIFLIAVRHTTQELADDLAPKLFREAKTLVQSSMLVVPQPVEFFQAVIILSLWSTTIGQVPLSIDSWLLTSHALVQASSSPAFTEIFRGGLGVPTQKSSVDIWCIWNHLCVAHLQYCIGTGRQAFLNQSQIDRCLRLMEADHVTNYEARMTAEVKLYWIIYQQCCGRQVDLNETKLALQGWQQEWAALFNQTRSQFLQMGFHFAHLLAYSQCLRSQPANLGSSVITDMVQLSKTIINLAIDTADERTKHLTDHIYHVVTFSALTLSRLLHMYESKLQAANHDIVALDQLIILLVDWLKSIGLRCHVAYMLSDIVLSQFKKLRPNSLTVASTESSMQGDAGMSMADDEFHASDVAFSFPDFIESELLNFDENATSWPQWDSS